MPKVGAANPLGFTAGAWRAWTQPLVRDGGVWVDPDLVFAFHDGDWRLVWALVPADPVSATAAVTDPGEVTIDWDSDEPEAVTTYEVRRADGSLAGSVVATGAASYQLVDTAARALTGSYTVTAKLGTTSGAGTATNSLSLATAPTGVTRTLSNTGVDTNVQVDWDAVTVATGYNVYRPNGELVGSVGVGVLTLTDTNPKPGVGSYTVRARVNTTTSSAGASASTTYAGTPSGLGGSVSGGDNVALTWSVAAVGTHDAIQVLRNGGVLATIAAGSTSYTDTNAAEGTQTTYRVRAVISGNAGSQSAATVESIAANPPTGASLTATATLGQLVLTWGHPAGSRTGYEVQVSDNGSAWSGVADDISPSANTFTGGSGVRYMRVRTLSVGGASAYVERSLTPLWDSTPPPDATITGWAPEASYGRMIVRFTIAASGGTHQYLVQRNVNDAGWTNFYGWANTSPSAVVAHNLGTFTAGTDIKVRIQVRDVYGNTRVGPQATYILQASPKLVFAAGSGAWAGSGWTGTLRPRQGTTGGVTYTGAWFYGATAVEDACDSLGGIGTGGKLYVTQIRALVPRAADGGPTTVYPIVWTHDRTVFGSQSLPTMDNGTNFPGVFQTADVEIALNQPARAALVHGDRRGIGLFAVGTQYYMQADNTSENPSSGRLTIHHLG